MAFVKDKLPDNVPGKYYVDRQCIDCDVCRDTSPANFARNDENGYSFVYKQPSTAMEFELLHTFVTHPRRPLNRDQLLELAHHKKWDPFDRSVDNRIARLRKKVESDPAKPTVIRTMHGEGYMFVPDAE